MPQAIAHAWRNICCHSRCLLMIRNCCNRHWETRSAVCVAGLEELRSWMKAELFLTNYRPVPLTEYAVFKGCVYAKVNSCFTSQMFTHCLMHHAQQHLLPLQLPLRLTASQLSFQVSTRNVQAQMTSMLCILATPLS